MGLKKLLSSRPPQNKIFFLIGPEGGFSKEEVANAQEKGFISVSLGRRILRSETVSLALLSIIQYEWGDLSLK